MQLLWNGSGCDRHRDPGQGSVPSGAYCQPMLYMNQEKQDFSGSPEAGCPTFNGMYMLLHQGVKAFHIWTGLDMPVELVREKYFK